jgi:hypothetical protein
MALPRQEPVRVPWQYRISPRRPRSRQVIARRANHQSAVKPRVRKYFALPEFGFTVSNRYPGPSEGTFRDRHDTLGRGCDGRCGVRRFVRRTRTLAAYGEVVWSWRRDPGATPAGVILPATGARKAASPGRARISRKTIARGKPGCPGCSCGLTRVLRSALFAHGTTGAVGARLSLRPPISEGQRDCTTRAKSRRGNAIAYPQDL